MFTTRGTLRFSFDYLPADVLPDRKDILSLDGGGFRGLSSLVILDHISAFDLRDVYRRDHLGPLGPDCSIFSSPSTRNWVSERLGATKVRRGVTFWWGNISRLLRSRPFLGEIMDKYTHGVYLQRCPSNIEAQMSVVTVRIVGRRVGADEPARLGIRHDRQSSQKLALPLRPIA